MATVMLLVLSSGAISRAGDDDDGAQRHARIQTEKIRRLYADLEYPTPTQIITGKLSVKDIFADNVRGRVTPVGAFDDSESVLEYFFALAATPNSRVTQTTIRKLTASNSRVAVAVDVHFERTSGGGFTLRQTGFFTFDRHDRVTSFDLAILNLGAEANPKSDADRAANIQGICAVLTVGALGQPPTCPGEYTSFQDCVSFMSSIPYGTWDRANSNSVVCRTLHTLLTPFRPAVHCPHAGKTGGMMCIDFSYESFWDEDY